MKYSSSWNVQETRQVKLLHYTDMVELSIMVDCQRALRPHNVLDGPYHTSNFVFIAKYTVDHWSSTCFKKSHTGLSMLLKVFSKATYSKFFLINAVFWQTAVWYSGHITTYNDRKSFPRHRYVYIIIVIIITAMFGWKKDDASWNLLPHWYNG